MQANKIGSQNINPVRFPAKIRVNTTSLQVDKIMMTNTDNSVQPPGIGGAARNTVAPSPAVAKEVRGTGPSANTDTAALASVKQSAVVADSKKGGEQSKPVDTAENLQQVADALSRTFGEKQSLQFSVDSDTGVSVIKVTQAGTGEVVRQIPNEEALVMMQRLDQRKDSGNDTAVLFDQMA